MDAMPGGLDPRPGLMSPRWGFPFIGVGVRGLTPAAIKCHPAGVFFAVSSFGE